MEEENTPVVGETPLQGQINEINEEEKTLDPEQSQTEIPTESGDLTTGVAPDTETSVDLTSPYLSEDFVGYALVPTDMLLIMILGILLMMLVLGRRVF